MNSTGLVISVDISATNNTNTKIYLNTQGGYCFKISENTILSRLNSWHKSYVEVGEIVMLHYNYHFSRDEVNDEDYKFVMYFNKEAQLATYLKDIDT